MRLGLSWKIGALLLLALTCKARALSVADNLPQPEQLQRYLSGDPVIDRALGLIPPMPNKVVPMKRTELHPLVQQKLSSGAAAFHTPGSTNLTVLTDSPMYAAAMNEQDKLSQYLLASAILHEQQHDKYPGELEPYQAQLKFLETYMPTNNDVGGDATKWKDTLGQYKKIIANLQHGNKVPQ